jgi:hypothetical protein
MDGHILCLLALGGTLTAGTLGMAGQVQGMLADEASIPALVQRHVEAVARDATGVPVWNVAVPGAGKLVLGWGDMDRSGVALPMPD